MLLGSGYLVAVMGHMVGPKGSVVGKIEENTERKRNKTAKLLTTHVKSDI